MSECVDVETTAATRGRRQGRWLDGAQAVASLAPCWAVRGLAHALFRDPGSVESIEVRASMACRAWVQAVSLLRDRVRLDSDDPMFMAGAGWMLAALSDVADLAGDDIVAESLICLALDDVAGAVFLDEVVDLVLAARRRMLGVGH